MNFYGRSLPGMIALIHFLTLAVTFTTYVAYLPVRPNEATWQQILVSQYIGLLLDILVFPLRYVCIGMNRLLGVDDKAAELQVIWIALAPVNSLLWGYCASALIQTTLMRLRPNRNAGDP